MIVRTLHKVSSGILCIFLPDFKLEVGVGVILSLRSQMTRVFHISLNTPFSQRWFTFTGERSGSFTPILNLNALCAI